MTHRRFYVLAMRRMYRWIAGCTASGVVTLLIWRGWRDAAGFAIGAALSALVFRWFQGIAQTLGASAETP